MSKPRTIHYKTPERIEIGVHRVTPSSLIDVAGLLRVAMDTQATKRHAWRKADWFIEACGGQRAANQRTEKIFDYRWRQLGKIAGSLVTPRGNTFLRATHGPDPRGETVATGRFRHDVSGGPMLKGGPLQKPYKHLLRPDKQYGCIGDVDTMPGHQRRGFGLAVVDAGLRVLNPRLVTTVYVASNNVPLQEALGNLFFVADGSKPRPDLYGNEPGAVEEIRMVGPRVGRLQEALHLEFPWLADAVVVA